MARKRKERELKSPIITVIGEGLTEHYYSEHLRTICGYKYNCKPRFFVHQNLKDIYNLIQEIVNDGGVVVCLFDADVTRNDKTAKAEYDTIFRKFGNNENVVLCDSMPSIEFWFLIHYLETNKYFQNSEAVIKVLHKYIKDYNKTEKFLCKPEWVAQLLSNGRMDPAILRAKTFGQSGESFSNIYKAIERFAMSVKKQ